MRENIINMKKLGVPKDILFIATKTALKVVLKDFEDSTRIIILLKAFTASFEVIEEVYNDR